MGKTIGFIGVGNMGGAIIEGLVNSKIAAGNQIYAYDLNQNSLKVKSSTWGINVAMGNIDVLEKSDIIFLAVKPQVIDEVLNEISMHVKQNHILISMSPGISLTYLKSFFNFNVKLIRIMPNTPALVGAGMTGLSCASSIEEEEKTFIKKILSSIGLVEEIKEDLLDAVTAISGSSPAYVDIFIESLADGGVLLGLPRDKAYIFATQAVIGAAKMILETGRHPGELKDAVCSPAGTTIAAVHQLEKHGFRNAIIEAMIAVDEQSKKMSK